MKRPRKRSHKVWRWSWQLDRETRQQRRQVWRLALSRTPGDEPRAFQAQQFADVGDEGAEALDDLAEAVLHGLEQPSGLLAANAYFCRWGVEVLFQDVKQCFAIEDARVRTFRRLENLLAFCTLAYSYFAHVLPNCAEESRRLLKTMKDSLGEIVEGFRPFVANVRELLRLERTRFISGRPRKRKPPDLTALLPGFPP